MEKSLDLSREKEELRAISEQHSYVDGFNGRLTKFRAQKIRELNPAGGSLLDLGAGEGNLTVTLAPYFDKITVTEASPTYMDRAKSRLADHPVAFINTLIEEFETEERFDLILASGILEHVASPQQVLKQVKGWLKSTGVFIVIVPNATALHRQVGVQMGMLRDYYELGALDRKVGHRRYYDLEQLTRELTDAGFSVIRSGGILLKPLPNDQMEKLSEAYCEALYHIGNDHAALCAEIYCSCRLR